MTQKITITILLFLTTFQTFAQTDKVAALIDEGIALYDQGKYAEAIDKYKESYKLDSNSVVLFAEMAMTYLALKDYDNTESICQRAITKFPDNKGLKNIYSTYGNSLDDRQKPDEALKIYIEGISKFPDYYMLHFNKGITEYGLKRNYEARTSFQNAIKSNPKHASSYYYLGIVEDNFGNRIPAILCLSRFLILEPKGQRAEKILPYLTKAVNNMYYQQKNGNSTATYSSAKARTDTTASSFEKVEFGILTIETTSSLFPENEKKTDLEKFETRTQTIYEYLKAYKNENSGFYWDFLAPYFIDLESKKYVKTFTYYINYYLTDNKDVEKWIKKNEKDVTEFYDWSKNYKW
jgi:tetratricopeptide (TPR) repeat protein